MIASAVWVVGYLMIGAAVYLRTRNVLIAATMPLVAYLLMLGVARLAVETGGVA